MGNSIVIMDSFALPVQGTETRVNAANEANEYMVEYIQGSEKVQSQVFLPFFLSVVTVMVSSGRKVRERHWLVSLPSRLRVLALWNRRRYTNE
jgi:hypothetical protein